MIDFEMRICASKLKLVEWDRFRIEYAKLVKCTSW